MLMMSYLATALLEYCSKSTKSIYHSAQIKVHSVIYSALIPLYIMLILCSISCVKPGTTSTITVCP